MYFFYIYILLLVFLNVCVFLDFAPKKLVYKGFFRVCCDAHGYWFWMKGAPLGGYRILVGASSIILPNSSLTCQHSPTNSKPNNICHSL